MISLSDPLQQDLDMIFKKWSSRWQKQLAQEDLPPLVREAVAEKLAKAANQSQEPPSPEQPAPAARTQEPAQRHRQQAGHQQRHQSAKNSRPQPDQVRRDNSQRPKLEKSQLSHQKSFPDVGELLRHLQAHFNELRDELQTARKQLERTQPTRKQGDAPSIETGKELAKLRDENAQLKETVTQLRETLGELANDNFNEAVSRKADTDVPVTDPVEQYKSLLTLRVREQIVNFQALNPDSHVDGLPLLLDNIFRTLQESGIDLTNIEPAPPPVRRRY
jgi:chromosome segregation ATPase